MYGVGTVYVLWVCLKYIVGVCKVCFVCFRVCFSFRLSCIKHLSQREGVSRMHATRLGYCCNNSSPVGGSSTEPFQTQPPRFFLGVDVFVGA